MALVLVLGVLVLFTGLALAIFLTATTERRTSALFAGSVEARQLADTGINLCMAQIRDATSATNRAWVSQPGLIRTFTGNRQPDTNYRLYSWTDMRPAGAFDPFSPANAVPSGWKTKKAAFVDINEPAPDPASPADTTRDKYPVFYPPSMTGNGSAAVAGYSVKPISGNGTTDEVPMPVKWLYVLKDGSVKEASEESDTTVRVSAATDANPIVGRIAFWADDESAKLNLNTAAGGYPWMPPWVQNRLEYANTTTLPFVTATKDWGNVYGFGYAQPMKNEFQRYPGHPATTDLRAVFPELSWRDIYRLIPRVIQGGSENGINRVRRWVSDNADPIETVNDRDRVFAGLGEARFDVIKTSPSVNRTSIVSSLPDASSTLSEGQWDSLLEKRKAFLTTSSKAPELNLFGQPRVAIWPVPEFDTAPQNLPYRTPLDKLIAFCATLVDRSQSPAQKFAFYFNRRTGPFVGSGSVPATTAFSPSDDIGRQRNTQLFRYLQRLTDSPFPGLSSGVFGSKYGGARGRDQILTEIFDYIRCTNIEDKQLNQARRFSERTGYVVPTRWNAGNGEITGFGRGFSIRQIGFLFICNADAAVIASNIAPKGTKAEDPVDPAADPAAVPPLKPNLALEAFPAGKLAANQRRIQALLILEFFSPSAGSKSFLNTAPFGFRVNGLQGMTLTSNSVTQNLGFPAPQTTRLGDMVFANGPFGSFGGAVNYRWLYTGSSAVMDEPKDPFNDPPKFTYVSVPITVNVDPSTKQMTVSGASLTVESYYQLGVSWIPLASTSVTLQPTTLPLPNLANKNKYWAFRRSGAFGDSIPVGRFFTSETYTDSNKNGRYDLGEPFVDNNSNGLFDLGIRDIASSENNLSGLYTSDTLIVDKRIGTSAWEAPYDVIQTHILPHGDYRTLFAPPGSPNQAYVPVPDPNAGTNPITTPLALNPPLPQFRNLRHFLTDPDIGGGIFGYYTGTSLEPATGRRFTGQFIQPMLRQSDYPSGLNAPWTFSDWDIGSPWKTTDGPLINKPDEGNTQNGDSVEGGDISVTNPYNYTETNSELTGTPALYHSASRQIPSAVMFGSLPTGLISGQPWQTLLFRPDPGSHPGAKDPADHLLLDLFWMPVVEPYAISEPFATAGKVNMNYQIIPFTYIERSTGVRAVLHGAQIGAIPDDHPRGYMKIFSTANPGANTPFAFDINEQETLSTFASRFSSGNVFLTPSEITTVPLVPNGSTIGTLASFWSQHRLTGENIKERPYAAIYPRLTTKSNVFNVHYRVQTLRKRPGSAPTLWDETKDSVVAQLRGNAIIERFLDMNRSAGIPDYALPANANKNAETLYRFRILSNQEFNP